MAAEGHGTHATMQTELYPPWLFRPFYPIFGGRVRKMGDWYLAQLQSALDAKAANPDPQPLA